MSLVISLVMHDKAVIVGDLRATSVEDDSEKLGGIDKVFSLNDTVAYGITGDLDVMNEFNTWISEQKTITDKTNVNAAARLFRKYLRELPDPDVQIRVHVVGVGDGGKITLVELDYSDGYRINKIVPDKQSANWRTMYANVPPLEFISEGFSDLEDHESQAIAEMLADVNRKVSKLDDYVSPECKVITIY